MHVPSDAIVAAKPEQIGSLWGDKINSSVFDNSKLRSVVPDFQATMPFSDGIQETVAWFDADPSRQAIDHPANELGDRIVSVYTDALRLRVAKVGSETKYPAPPPKSAIDAQRGCLATTTWSTLRGS